MVGFPQHSAINSIFINFFGSRKPFLSIFLKSLSIFMAVKSNDNVQFVSMNKGFYSGILAVAEMQKATIFFIITSERTVLALTKPYPAKKIESLVPMSTLLVLSMATGVKHLPKKILTPIKWYLIMVNMICPTQKVPLKNGR
jgi:hypothetical protein